jgi:hypothetical protein
VDDGFSGRLTAKLTEPDWTARRLAAELAEREGYDVDESSISNLKHRKHPTSRLVGPICEMFGWPKPPIPGLTEEEAEALDILARARTLDPEKARKTLDVLREWTAAEEKLRKLNRSNPDDPA